MIGPVLIDRRGWRPPREVVCRPIMQTRFDLPRLVRRAATL
jgi:hypothetical protein